MYEEEKKGSFIKDLIIKLLYMLLFLFLFMWLYPAPKVDLSDVKVKVDKTELEPLYAGIFNDNITAMKEAARSYFTTDRLPATNGGKVKLTLQEMLNKKMLVPFVDKNGKSCDTNASYVEVTRNSTYDYNMKVYLACDDEKDYINETIGCTSICPGCVNEPTKVVTSTTNAGYGSVGNSTTTTIVRPSSTTTTNNSSNDNKPVQTPAKEYVTVYFDSKGGSSVSSQTVEKGNTVTNPTTTKDEYKFLCWSTQYNDTSCNSEYNFNTPVNKNMTLYAQWVKENKVMYEYVKEVDTWTLNNTWTSKKKTGNDVREYDRKTVYETSTDTESFTYRTISWFHGYDNNYSYGLYLNNIPENATNVRITSSAKKFTSSTDLRNYVNNRYSCDIQMVGYSCPSKNQEAIIEDQNIFYTPIGSFRFTTSGIVKSNGRWKINFKITNNGGNDYDTIYLAPIKFTVSWDEETEEKVTKYKYEYLTTSKDYKYSSSKNDTSLLNNGYKLTGNTK